MCMHILEVRSCFYVFHSNVKGFPSTFFSTANNLPFFSDYESLHVYAVIYIWVYKHVCACVSLLKKIKSHEGWIQMLYFHSVFISHGQGLWCSCQSEQVTPLLTSSPPRSLRLMSLCWVDASILHGQWKRHSWWLGAGRGLPWSATICLRAESLMVLSTWYSSVCPHAPHTMFYAMLCL